MTTMMPLLRTKMTGIWFVLVAATLLSWWLGTDHGFGSSDDPESAAVVILVVAFVKARLVGLYFMDLKEAPGALRWGFEAYCVGMCALMLLAYFVL